jgi:hypothetical protein
MSRSLPRSDRVSTSHLFAQRQAVDKAFKLSASVTSFEHGNTFVGTQEKVLSRAAFEQRVESCNGPSITTYYGLVIATVISGPSLS